MDGLWQEAPIDMFVSEDEQDMFEFGLLYTPQLGDYLRSCDCKSDFLEKMFVNVESLGELILEVYCDGRLHWVWMDNMPPEEIETYDFNPIDE